jgi:hypothetical protein
MALLGIAGAHAFLRAPNGQTGLLKEERELSIFGGFGGERLQSKESHP